MQPIGIVLPKFIKGEGGLSPNKFVWIFNMLNIYVLSENYMSFSYKLITKT